MNPTANRDLTVLRTLFLIVAVVAGIAGVVMLIAPDETARYFSWPIGPPPLAARVGGLYVASAVVFGLAGWRGTWADGRGLSVGVLALTIPTVVITLRHHDLFDFGRWQAVAWIALFIASPIAYGTILFRQRGQASAPGSPLPTAARWILFGLGMLSAVGAVGLLLDPTGANGLFPVPALSGRFLGCWAAFLTTLAIMAAKRNRREEAFVPTLALVLFPLGEIAGAARTFDDLAPPGRRAGHLFVNGLVSAIAAVVLWQLRVKPGPQTAPARDG